MTRPVNSRSSDTVLTGSHVARHRQRLSTMRGFTLIEAILVIVITGIIGTTIAIFLKVPVTNYVDSVDRAELADEADTSLRRIARDLRLSLPNSIRVTNVGSVQYIEMLMTKSGGRYLAEEDGVALPFLSFTNPALTTFTVVGTMPTGTQAILANNFIVVYNLGPGLSPADAYAGGNRALVNSVAGSVVTMSTNPFGSQSPAMSSPLFRFQVVEGPVTYVCDPATGTLTRYWGYTIAAAQPTALATLTSVNAGALLSTHVSATGCTFDYSALSSLRSGLVGLTINLTKAGSNTGSVVLFHQVHVENTP